MRVRVSVAAYEAICSRLAALPKDAIGLKPLLTEKGERVIQLGASWFDTLHAMRRTREPYSAVIQRIAQLIGEDETMPIMANSIRLLRDAILLKKHERYASAFALAVLALEEVGKVVLRMWSLPERDKESLHLRKQRAVASLLLGQFAAKEFGPEVAATKQIPADLYERAAKAMFESEQGRFSRFVDLTAVDKTKQAALYCDDWFQEAGVHVNDFTVLDVESLVDKCDAAINAIGEPKAMRAGKAIFNTQATARHGVRSDVIGYPELDRQH